MRGRVLLALLIFAAYSAAIAVHGGLSFEPLKDEEQFWHQTKYFAENLPPTLEQVRRYGEPMTPLSFLAWASLERVHHGGIAGGRAFNVVAGIAILVLVGLAAPRDLSGDGVLACAGLLVYPYFLPISTVLYTDTLAAFFVVASLSLHLRGRPIAAAVLAALAIATRQYMVAFPAALLAWEATRGLRAGKTSWPRVLAPLAASASLLGWVWFFGGIAPEEGLARWPRHASPLEALAPGHAVYFLSVIGAYFVLPEFVLFRRWRTVDWGIDRYRVLYILAVCLLFLVFTPDYPNPATEETMGALNRSLHIALGDWPIGSAIRLATLLVLACLAVLRFSSAGLSLWIVASNAALMIFLWTAWEKYALPVLAVLWYLRAAGSLHGTPHGPRWRQVRP